MHSSHIAIAAHLALSPIYTLQLAQISDNVQSSFIWWGCVATLLTMISLLTHGKTIDKFYYKTKAALKLTYLPCAIGAALGIYAIAQNRASEWTEVLIVLMCFMIVSTIVVDCLTTRHSLVVHEFILDTKPWKLRPRKFRCAMYSVIIGTFTTICWQIFLPNFMVILPSSNSTLTAQPNATLSELIQHWVHPSICQVISSVSMALSSLVLAWYRSAYHAHIIQTGVLVKSYFTTTWKSRCWPAFTLAISWILSLITSSVYLVQASGITSLNTITQKIGLPVVSVCAIAYILVFMVWTPFTVAQLLLT